MNNQNCANCGNIQGKVKVSRNGGEDIVKWPKPSFRCHDGHEVSMVVPFSKKLGVRYLDFCCNNWVANVD